jgi:hypothetical protein
VIKLMIVMFKEALVQADEHDAQAGERIGDFWGLPSCFKGMSSIPGILVDLQGYIDVG